MKIPNCGADHAANGDAEQLAKNTGTLEFCWGTFGRSRSRVTTRILSTVRITSYQIVSRTSNISTRFVGVGWVNEDVLKARAECRGSSYAIH